jgi:hypothetical protein
LKHYNKGIAAHMIAILELVDDDHLVFTNVNGVGPIDIVTVNTKTGKVDLYDAKSDRESRHYKRPINEIQKKLKVKQFYINLKKRTYKLGNKRGSIFANELTDNKRSD